MWYLNSRRETCGSSFHVVAKSPPTAIFKQAFAMGPQHKHNLGQNPAFWKVVAFSGFVLVHHRVIVTQRRPGRVPVTQKSRDHRDYRTDPCHVQILACLICHDFLHYCLLYVCWTERFASVLIGIYGPHSCMRRSLLRLILGTVGLEGLSSLARVLRVVDSPP